MPPLTAAQHFFSSVPADQSPKRRRGYQTLFRTPSLSDEVVRFIEDRAQYTTAPGNPVKRQFYPLPHGQVAISQSVELTGLDEFGRKGRYLSHTLILDDPVFQQLGACPLDVFAQFQFATALTEVFQQGKLATGEVTVASLNITPEWHNRAVEAAQQWTPEILVRLGRLAWQVGLLIDQRETICLLGPEADQLTVLGVLFLLASPLQRTQLSFDTHAAGCDWGRGVFFWAEGYSNQFHTRTAYVIDTHARSVTSNLSPANDGVFATWMAKWAIPTHLVEIWPKQIWAAQLEVALTNTKLPPEFPSSLEETLTVTQIPRNFVERFAQINVSAVIECWITHLPSGLSPQFNQRLATHIAANSKSILEILLEGVQPPDIHEFMFRVLLELDEIPAKTDRQILEKWIKTSSHPGLQTLPSLWAKDSKVWVRSLTSLNTEDYEFILERLVRWSQPLIPLHEALVEPHATVWLRLAAPVIPSDDWKNALRKLEQIGEPMLEQLARVSLQLSKSSQEQIVTWLKDYKGSATALRRVLGVPAKSSKNIFKLF